MKETANSVSQASNIVQCQENSLKEAVNAFEEIGAQMDELNYNIVMINNQIGEVEKAKVNTLESIEDISVVLEETAAASTEVLQEVSNQEATAEKFDYEVRKLKQNSEKLRESIKIFKV